MPSRFGKYIDPPKTNIATQNDGLEKVTPFKHGIFLVSTLDFWGVVKIEIVVFFITLLGTVTYPLSV